MQPPPMAEGAAFFRQHCAGRAGMELMFRHADGRAWKASEQARPIRDVCERAKIEPAISFHILRHTWASHAVMTGVPLMVVAKNLGHADTRMVEKHYGHLAPSFITDAIRAGAPRYGLTPSQQVVPLR
jgi:site-specific recombinase XerD